MLFYLLNVLSFLFTGVTAAGTLWFIFAIGPLLKRYLEREVATEQATGIRR